MTTDGNDRHGSNSSLVPRRPTRVVLGLQLTVTAVFAAAATYWAGWHGALSALLGGTVSIVSGLVFIVLTSNRKVRTADGVLFVALRAEGAKIASIVALLWLVLSLYTQIVPLAFFGAFATTVIIFSLAFFVREN